LVSLQFEQRAGSQAGTQWVARRFPFQIGRSASSDLKLKDAGVFEEHAWVERQDAGRVIIRPVGAAIVSLNGSAITESPLQSGDTITLGGAELRVWLAPVRQRARAGSELLFWTFWIAVLVSQFALIRALWR
jgi:predicted component of type VI protein secretion system